MADVFPYRKKSVTKWLVTKESYNVSQISMQHAYSVRNFPSPILFSPQKWQLWAPFPFIQCWIDSRSPSLVERHHCSLKCYSYHHQAKLLYGGRDFVVCLQHKLHEVFQDFGRHCSLRSVCVAITYNVLLFILLFDIGWFMSCGIKKHLFIDNA